MPRRLGLRAVALGYLVFILLAPLAMVFYRTFEHGLHPVWLTLSDHFTVHAFEITLLAAAIAVPLNTVFGVLCALAIVRRRFHGKGLLNAFIDLPLAVSPVVVGLSLYLLYGRTGWFGPCSKVTGSRSSSHCRRSCSRPSSSRCPSWRAR